MDELLREVAARYGVSVDLIRTLVAYERTKVHLERRRGAKDELRRQIEKYLEGTAR